MLVCLGLLKKREWFESHWTLSKCLMNDGGLISDSAALDVISECTVIYGV